MRRELGGDQDSIEMSVNKIVESNGHNRASNGTTTADTSRADLNKGKKDLLLNNKSKQATNSTAKSGKQQSLVDWVSSATKASGSKPVVNGSSNLVGQKRTDTQRLDRDR